MTTPALQPMPALLCLSAAGAATAERLASALPGALLHAPAGKDIAADIYFNDVKAQLQALFQRRQPIIGIMASAILIRCLAPVLQDKQNEPPVLAIAESGDAVVPLLGSHHGGNDLARRLAEILSVPAALTSASDNRFGLGLDAPPPGWVLANPQHVKDFTAALLRDNAVMIDGPTSRAAPWLRQSTLPIVSSAKLKISVRTQSLAGDGAHLVYYPPRLALGVGCARDCPPEDLIRLVTEQLAAAGLVKEAVASIVSLDLKMDEPAVHALAAAFNRPARFFSAERLEAETSNLANPSETVFQAVGCHGVAEAAALAAAGSDSRLVIEKQIGDNCTMAVAESTADIDPQQIGQPRGHLMLVGLGPGAPAWRSFEVDQALAQADDIVGYDGYLALLGRAGRQAVPHGFGLGDENKRVAHALALAAQGRQVALVCSGDPGIYAMASLAFEQLDHSQQSEIRRVAVTVMPGISALQAAAARLGAPLGHDFCAISLSDLLTPWAVIERRLHAAIAGDFVIALYNPVSKRRQQQWQQACTILQASLAAETCVAVARNLGRSDESLHVAPLEQLDNLDVDMFCVVLIGAAQTRRFQLAGEQKLYTPRGYIVKDKVEDKV